MKTYKMTTNAINWRITDEKDTDDTHQQVTSPSIGNEVNYDCSKDKSLTLLKNMAEAMDVSKRYKVMSLTYQICSNYLPIPVTGPEGRILDLLLVSSW
jgi:hypothetical protein